MVGDDGGELPTDKSRRLIKLKRFCFLINRLAVKVCVETYSKKYDQKHGIEIRPRHKK